MAANRRYAQRSSEKTSGFVEVSLGIREVESNLGITHGALKGWVLKHRDHKDAALTGRIDPQSPEAKLKQLCKENEQLRRVRDI